MVLLLLLEKRGTARIITISIYMTDCMMSEKQREKKKKNIPSIMACSSYNERRDN